MIGWLEPVLKRYGSATHDKHIGYFSTVTTSCSKHLENCQGAILKTGTTYITLHQWTMLLFFFHNQIRYIFEECFPEKQVEIKYSNRLPWITKCIRNSIDHKNKLHAIYSKNPSLEKQSKLYKV